MPNIASAFPSKYLKADDIEDGDIDPHMTIKGIAMEPIEQGKPNKPVLYFNECQKGVVLNKTNATMIAKSYGNETDDWIGKPVELFTMLVDFRGDMVNSIRMKVPKQKAALKKSASFTPNASHPNAPGNDMDTAPSSDYEE